MEVHKILRTSENLNPLRRHQGRHIRLGFLSQRQRLIKREERNILGTHVM
jgi:hypothetical protein